MTPKLTTHHTFTIRDSFLSIYNLAHNSVLRRPIATPRRSSPLLSAEELREIVKQMVD